MTTSTSTSASASNEIVVPIIIKSVRTSSLLGDLNKVDQHYHNVIVKDLQAVKYVPNPRRPGNYVRNRPITRYYDEDVTWPEHPLNIHGKIQGAIAIIRSLDNKILLVRNRTLWGLPKGARSYKNFLTVKDKTDQHYRETEQILVHDSAAFEQSETAIENVCREVLEETGIIMDCDKLKEFNHRDNQSGSYCAYDGFIYDYDQTSVDHYKDLQTHGTDHENDELLWVSYDELQQLFKTHKNKHGSVQKRVFNHVSYSYLDEYLTLNKS